MRVSFLRSRRPSNGVAARDHLVAILELDQNRIHGATSQHPAPLALEQLGNQIHGEVARMRGRQTGDCCTALNRWEMGGMGRANQGKRGVVNNIGVFSHWVVFFLPLVRPGPGSPKLQRRGRLTASFPWGEGGRILWKDSMEGAGEGVAGLARPRKLGGKNWPDHPPREG